jgi:hypothetical protein
MGYGASAVSVITTPCKRCSFENPPEARFCAECGEPMPVPDEPARSSQVLSAPTTIREPARDSPEALGRLDLEREMAARDVLRFSGLGRLVGALARETAKSARTQAIVNLAAVRATILARAKRDEKGEGASDPPKEIRRPLRDVVAKAESVAGDAKRDGLRAGQLAKEVDDRAAPSAAAVSEMASALDAALDVGQPDWTIDRTLERLGKLAVDAEKRGGDALRAYAEHTAELDTITDAHDEARGR